jgi:uncharacterized protein (TIGR03083 family)
MNDANRVTELIRTERLAFVELLESLTDDQWRVRSLCTEWTVENVAAHLAWAPATGPAEAVGDALRAGFRMNRMIAGSAVRWTARGRPAMLAQLRENAANGAKPLGVPQVAALTDAVVHGLDVRVPLGLHHPVDPEAFRLIADWALASRWPTTIPVGGSARRRFRGTQLVATDADWTWGEGTQVREPVDRILLMLFGRDDRRR